MALTAVVLEAPEGLVAFIDELPRPTPRGNALEIERGSSCGACRIATDRYVHFRVRKKLR